MFPRNAIKAGQVVSCDQYQSSKGKERHSRNLFGGTTNCPFTIVHVENAHVANVEVSVENFHVENGPVNYAPVNVQVHVKSVYIADVPITDVHVENAHVVDVDVPVKNFHVENGCVNCAYVQDETVTIEKVYVNCVDVCVEDAHIVTSFPVFVNQVAVTHPIIVPIEVDNNTTNNRAMQIFRNQQSQSCTTTVSSASDPSSPSFTSKLQGSPSSLKFKLKYYSYCRSVFWCPCQIVPYGSSFKQRTWCSKFCLSLF